MKMAVFWVVAPCSWYNFTDVSEVCTASIMRVMMLVNLYQSTRRYYPEDGHLQKFESWTKKFKDK
jgi:hypothetical protein